MNDRDLRILELRKLGLSYSWIGARVGVSKVRVGQVIRRERPDLAGPLPYHRVLTRQEISDVITLRLGGFSKELIGRITGITWQVQQRIYAPMPGLKDLRKRAPVEQIISMRRQGYKQREISKATGFSRSTVNRLISLYAPDLIQRQLSPTDEILRLHEAGLSGAEIARQLDMKAPTVRAVIIRRSSIASGAVE